MGGGWGGGQEAHSLLTEAPPRLGVTSQHLSMQEGSPLKLILKVLQETIPS